jgi:hypothetical protein
LSIKKSQGSQYQRFYIKFGRIFGASAENRAIRSNSSALRRVAFIQGHACACFAGRPAGFPLLSLARLVTVTVFSENQQSRQRAKLDPQKYAGQYNRKKNRKGEEGYRF